MQNKVKIIAITGGIGSGKSTISEILKGIGYLVVSCDSLTKKISAQHLVKKKIKEIVPSAVSGKVFLTVDNKVLSKALFNDSSIKRKIEDLLHPRVLKEAIRIAKKGKGLSFVEVPILFERGYQNLFDGVLIVTRDKDKRIESVIKRSNLTKEDVQKRIDAQADYHLIDNEKYIIINNNDDLDSLKVATKEALKKLLR